MIFYHQAIFHLFGSSLKCDMKKAPHVPWVFLLGSGSAYSVVTNKNRSLSQQVTVTANRGSWDLL